MFQPQFCSPFRSTLFSSIAGALRPLLYCAALFLALAFVSSRADPGAGGRNAPGLNLAGEGERLVYDIKWGIFKAGEAILDVQSLPQPDGGLRYLVELRAETSGLFAAVYPLDVYIESIMGDGLRRSLQFHKIQNGRVTRIDFDWKAGTARYSRDGASREPIVLPSDALDPLGIIMAARNQDLEVGSSLATLFTDGKRAIEGLARVIKEETVNTEAGEFITSVVEPSLQGVGGVFEESKNPRMRVWVSQDERRLPVRITSKIVLGSLVGELVDVQAL